MKKTLLIFLAFSFACENEVKDPAIDFTKITSLLDVKYASTFNSTLGTNLKSNSENNRLAYYADFAETTLNSVEDFYVNETDFTPLIEEDFIDAISQTPVLDLSFLTGQQEAIARPFLEDIMSQEELTYIDKKVWLFEKEITNSTLTSEQKYQLFSIASLIKQGVQVIRDAEAGLLMATTAGRIAKTIDVKAALRDGVIGLGIGAVRGAYVGCTGGTVVFPGLGTATGCVGGAVIGGAVGFIAGVGTNLLGQLFWN